MANKVKISKEEYDQLNQELQDRIARRALLKERVQNAIQKDMRVNDQLDRETRTYEQNEIRIRKLEEIISKSDVNKDIGELEYVIIGSVVEVEVNGIRKKIQILSDDSPAINPIEGRISQSSAIGKALIGQKSGSNVEVKLPMGFSVYKIRKVQY